MALNFLERSICYQFLVMKHTSKKVIYLLLFPIFLFVRSELAEKVYDPCSEFSGYVLPLAKCPSEKPEDEYLECYDKSYRESLEKPWQIRMMYWCWSRHDISDNDLKNLPISAGKNYDNSKFNDIINEPFTANFYINETHIFCIADEISEPIDDNCCDYPTDVKCTTSTGISVAIFQYTREKKL